MGGSDVFFFFLGSVFGVSRHKSAKESASKSFRNFSFFFGGGEVVTGFAMFLHSLIRKMRNFLEWK